MKANTNKIQPVLMLLCVILFTTATGSFRSIACKPSCDKPAETRKEIYAEPTAKKVSLPVMNPLQILSAKFL